VERRPVSALFKIGECYFLRKVKLKCTLVQALTLCTGLTAHRGSRSIALLFLNIGAKWGGWSTPRPGRSLPPGKTLYLLYRRLGGPQGRSGRVRKISPPPGFNHPNDQPVAQSLYRLSYPAHLVNRYYSKYLSDYLTFCNVNCPLIPSGFIKIFTVSHIVKFPHH
jgi:hypothetical protein